MISREWVRRENKKDPEYRKEWNYIRAKYLTG